MKQLNLITLVFLLLYIIGIERAQAQKKITKKGISSFPIKQTYSEAELIFMPKEFKKNYKKRKRRYKRKMKKEQRKKNKSIPFWRKYKWVKKMQVKINKKNQRKKKKKLKRKLHKRNRSGK